METAIVLTPNSFEELKAKIESINRDLGGLDYEIIAILPRLSEDERHYISENLKVTVLATGFELEAVNKQCISRYCIYKTVKYLLFLGMEQTISREELERRIKFLEVEQLIGVVGDKVEVKDEFVQKTITHKLLALLTLNKEEFDVRCCDEEGKIKCVNPGTLLTTVKMWDKIGGFPVVSADPYIEYCARVQALGYTIFPLTA
jgi:hypothetical protein